MSSFCRRVMSRERTFPISHFSTKQRDTSCCVVTCHVPPFVSPQRCGQISVLKGWPRVTALCALELSLHIKARVARASDVVVTSSLGLKYRK